jgi:hypothetical protein
VREYLKEFCGLTPASSASAADITIRIGAEFTKILFSDTEEDAMIMSARSEFTGSGISKNGATVFEKRYPFGTTLQMGNYYWEAAAAVRGLIAETLSKD